jgi:tRNA(Ile)-lysidine synthase
LAVSGGPDSTALAVLARAAGLEGTVVHVDHGLRPGSGTEAAVVESLAGQLGFAFSAQRVTVAPGPDLEARARRARYSVLPAGVLTGHTMDDQAETVLLNLLRGAALDGLAGMRPARRDVGPAGVGGPVPVGGSVRRPLLGLRRIETLEVCRRCGFRPLEDPTNADLRFRRNRVRGEILPLLENVAERDLVPVLARQAALMADDVEFLEEEARRIDPTDVAVLRTAAPALARRALRGWLRGGDGYHPPSASELVRVMEVVEGQRRSCQISGGRRVARKAGRLTLAESEAAVGSGPVGPSGADLAPVHGAGEEW